MGDIAVRPLVNSKAASVLVRIGTPRAIAGAVSLLWDSDPKACEAAAWALAFRSIFPKIDGVLRDLPLPPGAAGAPTLAWLWEPFGEPATSSLPAIAGRVGYLLASAPRPSIIDPRLALPVYVETRHNDFLLSMPSEVRETLVKRNPTRDDWRRVFQPLKYAFEKSALFQAVKIVFTLACVAGVSCGVFLIHAGMIEPRWYVALVYSGLLPTIASIKIWSKPQNDDERTVMSIAFACLPFYRDSKMDWKGALEFALYFLSGSWVPIVIYFTYKLLPLWAVVVLWVAIYAFGIAAFRIGYRRQRRANNPLHGLLPSPGTRPLAPRRNFWRGLLIR
jgi:hypothetical protein